MTQFFAWLVHHLCVLIESLDPKSLLFANSLSFQVLVLWMLFIMAFGTTFYMIMDEVTYCYLCQKNTWLAEHGLMSYFSLCI